MTTLKDMNSVLNEISIIQLEEIQKDRLLNIKKNKILVTKKVKPYIQNIFMAFDLKLKRKTSDTGLFQ